ncbi:hypothetical protein ACOMCU_24715, partial [Lysinibacillus sp. UGB7]|uniref:hypothetical protein n=1 Tax=Lysinibacillus sp. UGB7 TaxID=3411039 RepID=UPI003B77E8A9
LDIYIRIKKRKSYESSKRKNKKNQTRYTRLRDYFDILQVLNIQGYESMFVSQNDFYRIFKNELLLHTEEQNITEFLEHVITYFKDMKLRNISIEDSRFDSQYRTWLFMIREVIEKSYFGSILKEYLIQRYELKKAGYFRKEEDAHHLFLSERQYQKFHSPIEPYIVNGWLERILEQCEIERYDGTLNLFTKHNIKRTLSIHTFRHTYITYRIGYESMYELFNQSSLAQLKKEVGHVIDSEVTLSRYYFLDQKRNARANTAIYKFLVKHIKKDDAGGE